MNKKKPKLCTCCGANAGHWEQWHNQEEGYGICRSCVDGVMARRVFGCPNPGSVQLEFCSSYGLPGQHYEARTHCMHGQIYAIVADFPDTVDGTKYLSAFMEAFHGVGVLEVAGSRVILASNTDKAIGRILTVTRKEFGLCLKSPFTICTGSETLTS